MDVTIGIVTFNQPQRTLIESLLRQLIGETAAVFGFTRRTERGSQRLHTIRRGMSHHGEMTSRIRAHVLVVSDAAVQDPDENRAAPVALQELTRAGIEATSDVIAADPDALRTALHASSAEVIITCGATGVRPHDIAPEVTRAELVTELPGISEEIRRRGASRVPYALASRGVCGVLPGPVVVLNAPGSRGGVRDAIAVLLEVLPDLWRDLTGAPRD